MCWGEGHLLPPCLWALTSPNPTSPQGVQCMSTRWPLATKYSLLPRAATECMCHVSHIHMPMTKWSRKDTASQDRTLDLAPSHNICDLEQIILLLWRSVSPMAEWRK